MWNWSWDHGDPYMSGWGLVIMLGILVILFSPVIVHRLRSGRTHRR